MAGAAGADVEQSPVGLWKTVDDRTHKPRGIIRIYERNNEFYGRIEASFDPAERVAHCAKCTGERKNAPVIGLEILSGISRRGLEYSGGEILDPETGWVYKCQFSLSADGEKLLVRGYLGLPILGRTQTWTRVENAEAP